MLKEMSFKSCIQQGNTDKLKVLIVDDDENVLDILAEGVSCAGGGYEVYTAVDGYEAAEKISVIIPDIVVLDVVLPGIDGFKVCKMIKNIRSSIKVIAITGKHVRKLEDEIKDCGADAYLAKPFDIQNLLSLMADFDGQL